MSGRIYKPGFFEEMQRGSKKGKKGKKGKKLFFAFFALFALFASSYRFVLRPIY
jgi:hypothetical protein